MPETTHSLLLGTGPYYKGKGAQRERARKLDHTTGTWQRGLGYNQAVPPLLPQLPERKEPASTAGDVMGSSCQAPLPNFHSWLPSDHV